MCFRGSRSLFFVLFGFSRRSLLSFFGLRLSAAFFLRRFCALRCMFLLLTRSRRCIFTFFYLKLRVCAFVVLFVCHIFNIPNIRFTRQEKNTTYTRVHTRSALFFHGKSVLRMIIHCAQAVQQSVNHLDTSRL